MCERDILRRYVWSDLSDYYNPKGIDIQLIDLRWGVVAGETDSETIEEKILKCCTDTIDVCKPFFIGFIGHRYGWIPKRPDSPADTPLSVTHIEIEHGIIESDNYARSLIFKRNMDSYNNVHTNELKAYVDNEKELREFAERQYSRIHQGFINADASGNLIPYTLDVVRASEDEIYEFTQLVTSNLIRIIDDEISCVSEYSFRHACELFLNNYMVPSEPYMDILSNVFSGKHSLVYGDLGTGKTSLALYLYRRLKSAGEQLNSFFYSPDIHLDDDTTFKETISSWSESLSGVELEPLGGLTDEWSRFKQINNSQSKYSVIILDGYDKLVEIRDSNLFLLPSRGIIYVVFSSSPLQKWETRYQISPLILDDFTTEKARMFIDQKICASNKKSLPEFVYDAILSERKHGAGRYNPLDLSVLTSYILSMDKDDFDKVNQVKDIPQERALYDYLVSIIKEMPKNEQMRSAYILKKVIDIFGKKKLTPLIYMALSLHGLSESELALLDSNYNPVSFYLIRNYLRPYLPSSNANGRWALNDNEIAIAIRSMVRDADSERFLFDMSCLDSISDEEKFFYAIHGHNAPLVYEMYSSKDMRDGHREHESINAYLQRYMENEGNVAWFLSLLEYDDAHRNKRILSNLIYSFYSKYARQNPDIDIIGFLKSALEKIESGKVNLPEKDLYYYCGVLSEEIGREILDRNVIEADRIVGMSYLQKALSFYGMTGSESQLSIEYLNNYINRLSR